MFRRGKQIFVGLVNSKSKTFLTFCFCFIVGVAFASWTVEAQLMTSRMFVWLCILLLLAGFFKPRKVLCFIFLCQFCVVAGVVRYSLAFPDLHANIGSFNGQQKTITAFVATEPDVRTDGVRYVLRVVNVEDELSQVTQGNIYLKSGLYPRYAYGELLRVTCQLMSPEPIEDFRYDMYLARLGVFSICSRPQIVRLEQPRVRSLLTDVLRLKATLADRISIIWHEPYASFMAGLLYGYRGGLGSLNEDFNRTGVTHIVAISGYNISIVAGIISSILVRSYLPRKKAFYLVVSGIALFVVFTGASASVVRAGIMGSLVLLARHMGRLSWSPNSLLCAVVLMALHNPFILIWDVGFQLSFLATVGIIYITPVFEKRLTGVSNILGLRESVASTCAAILITLPLTLYQFQRFSVVAPLVNVLILWIIPWTMAVGAATVITSFLVPISLPLFRFVSFICMSYVVWVVRWFSSLPFASKEFSLSFPLMISAYTLLVFWLAHRYKKSVI